jgi:DNA-directed RNA polymerase subunit RPC12/RpoP
MNILKKLFGKKSFPNQSSEAYSGNGTGDKRECAGCSRAFIAQPIEVENIGIAVRKRYRCPHCGTSMNYFDKT